jgi:uncharacterized protein
MDNPVVVRAAEACQTAGLATLRFNFRGVGASGGVHGDGVTEQDDVLGALDSLARQLGSRALGVAGYSFGAWVGALAGCRDSRVAALALIAPPLAMYDLGCLEGKRVPTLVVGGDRDVYCPAGDLRRMAARCPWMTPAVIEGADHFFADALDRLGEAISPWAHALASSTDGCPVELPSHNGTTGSHRNA